jgi:hypothetical protein
MSMSGGAMHSNIRSELISYLSAWPRSEVLAALKAVVLEEYGELKGDGWRVYKGSTDSIPNGYDWRGVNGKIYIRPHIADMEKQLTTEPVAVQQGKKFCPDCGSEAFPQPVCPSCEKGKAGFRHFWVCGDDPEHTIFYTE